MQKYPDKKGSIYTATMGVRLEPELRERFKCLRSELKTDVCEAIRMKLRELARELEQTKAS